LRFGNHDAVIDRSLTKERIGSFSDAQGFCGIQRASVLNAYYRKVHTGLEYLSFVCSRDGPRRTFRATSSRTKYVSLLSIFHGLHPGDAQEQKLVRAIVGTDRFNGVARGSRAGHVQRAGPERPVCQGGWGMRDQRPHAHIPVLRAIQSRLVARGRVGKHRRDRSRGLRVLSERGIRR
jgi:hypothetical protein